MNADSNKLTSLDKDRACYTELIFNYCPTDSHFGHDVERFTSIRDSRASFFAM